MLITDQVATAPCTDPIQDDFPTFEAKQLFSCLGLCLFNGDYYCNYRSCLFNQNYQIVLRETFWRIVDSVRRSFAPLSLPKVEIASRCYETSWLLFMTIGWPL